MGAVRQNMLGIVLLILSLKGNWSRQKFSVEPDSVLVAPGLSTTLPCLVDNKVGECRWSKGGKPVGMFGGKYEMRGATDQGDCSLTLYSLDLRIDDGQWQCQVTASNITSQDALVSRLARLTVQVPPSEVQLRTGEILVKDGDIMTVTEDKVESITCVTRNSNPAPLITWMLGSTVLTTSVQTNTSEAEAGGDGAKFRSESVLSHSFSQTDLAASLQCIVQHPAYDTGQEILAANIDVLYKPSVSIERHTSSALEAGRGSLTLTCNSQSNPPGRVMWYRQGEGASPQYRDQLVFDPVTKAQAGDYVCVAENSVGRSREAVTNVEVLYGPENLITSPVSAATVGLHNRTSLSCSAEAVPSPGYEWLQELPGGGEVRRRSNTATLEIEDAWYADQGLYRCVASNNIGNKRREAQSEAIALDITGPPQITSNIRNTGVNSIRECQQDRNAT